MPEFTWVVWFRVDILEMAQTDKQTYRHRISAMYRDPIGSYKKLNLADWCLKFYLGTWQGPRWYLDISAPTRANTFVLSKVELRLSKVWFEWDNV